MDTFDMVSILQSSAAQWADYLEESKKYGYGNLETDSEITEIREALQASVAFLENKDADFEKWLQSYIDSNADDLHEKFLWDKDNGLL